MADNVTLPGTGEVVATDDVSGRQYQRFKLTDGLADSETHARVLTTNADADTPGLAVRMTPQDTWSVSFTRVNGAALDSPEMTLRRQGTGVTVSQSAGNLVVGAGTTANSEFLARSVVTFNGSLIERHQTVLSTRIVNNNFAVLLADRIAEGASCTINSATSISVTVTGHGLTSANVGQSMFVGAITGANGVPGRYAIASLPDANTINFTVAGWPASGSCTVDVFGWNYVRWLYTGTGATTANVDAQRYGWNSGDTAATINTTASPGHIAQTQIDGRNIYFADGLVASATAPNLTVRGHRWVNIPDDQIELFLYLWSFNGTTAPASGTTWTVGFVAVEDTVNLPVYLAGVRPMGTTAPLPVFQTVAGPTQPVSGTVTANIGTGALAAGTNAIGDVGIQYRASATGAATLTNINCPATPAAQQLKSGAGRLIALYLYNTSGSIRWLKIFNLAGASVTPGVTSATTEIGIPAGQLLEVQLEGGFAFATGITVMITGGAGLTNNTAVTLGDVTGFSAHV
jgi:hypothetical protein